MTASDTALSGSAPPDPGPGERAGGRWPQAAPPAREPHRSESYRQLWQPPGRRPAHRQALGQPYVWAGTGQPAQAGQPSPRAELEYRRPRHGDPLGGPGVRAGTAAQAERAVIGDLLRVPIAWCQSGTCIARHADPAALGEADARARAVAAGWCEDAFGRLICPDCQQRYHVWSARPLAPRTSRPVAPAPRPASQPGAAGRHRRRY